MMQSEDQVWDALRRVMDPEIPVVSLLEMGIIRDVSCEEDCVRVTITPTFSGCPALAVMQQDIAAAIRGLGYAQAEVEVSLSPPWSTDWITPEGRKKLQNFGISPPAPHGGDVQTALLQPVHCPYCGSIKTSLRNSFGSTPCRMIFTCRDCHQPFEQFKPL